MHSSVGFFILRNGTTSPSGGVLGPKKPLVLLVTPWWDPGQRIRPWQVDPWTRGDTGVVTPLDQDIPGPGVPLGQG